MTDPFNFDHTITVGKLRELLADLPADMPVILAKDPEGNGFSPLSTAGQAMYLPESTWAGWSYPTPEMLVEYMANPCGGWSQEDVAPAEAVRVLELGPVN